MQANTGVSTPNVKWAQRKDKLFVTIDAVEVKNPEIDIVDGKTLKFKGSDSNHTYAFELELYDEVVKEESKFSLASRNIFLNIKKKTKGPYWPRLTKNSQKLNWLQVDWTHYIDEEDEEEDSKGPNFGNEMSN
jgi:prostaglandin-E synthase